MEAELRDKIDPGHLARITAEFSCTAMPTGLRGYGNAGRYCPRWPRRRDGWNWARWFCATHCAVRRSWRRCRAVRVRPTRRCLSAAGVRACSRWPRGTAICGTPATWASPRRWRSPSPRSQARASRPAEARRRSPSPRSSACGFQRRTVPENPVALRDGHVAPRGRQRMLVAAHTTAVRTGARSSSRSRDARGILPRRLHAVRPLDLHIARSLTAGNADRIECEDSDGWR
jgi:hypothetical protein